MKNIRISLAILSLTVFLGVTGTLPTYADDRHSASPVTLINAFEVPAGKLDAAITAWEAARDFLESQPGYIETTLHRTITPNAKFQLVNVAKWESAATFQAAIRKYHQSGSSTAFEGITYHPALYIPIKQENGS